MKKQILSALVMLLSSSGFVAAQTASVEKIFVIPDKAAQPDTAVMTVYHPEKPNGIVVVNCPGGGYSHLSMENEGSLWAPFYNEQGITFCLLKYRMPNGDRMRPMSDAQEAIRIVRSHKKDWNINPKKVGIIGYSAGGHLAATTATLAPKDAQPDFQILFYPVISMDKSKTHVGSCRCFLGEDGSNDPELINQFSCYNNVTKKTPKALLIWVETDTAVNPPTNVYVYKDALEKANVPCEAISYPTGKHGFGFLTKNISKEDHDDMIAKMKVWLKKL